MKIIYRFVVWGTAAGVRSTKEAAKGAFTWKSYPTRDIPRRDWEHIIAVIEEKEREV